MDEETLTKFSEYHSRIRELEKFIRMKYPKVYEEFDKLQKEQEELIKSVFPDMPQ